ncbi:PAS domain S-box protein [Hydrogenophaga sp. SNF1]|nr:PAS domain S-box protein [Hydrogenophaga sp. SNF1]WQB83160.1 PAS domain S-box protein [Hydrogenophaga sp. SNF1]
MITALPSRSPEAPWTLLPGPVLVLAADGTVRHASAALQAWLGPLAPQEDWAQDLQEPHRRLLRERLRATAPFEQDLSRATPRGGPRQTARLRLSARWLPEHGAWLCILSDLASHLDRCVEAREESGFLRAFGDAVPVMIAFYDRDQLLRYANRRYVRQYRLDPQRMIGRHISEVIGTANTLNAPFQDRVLLTSGEPETPVSFTRYLERSDGSRQWVNITLAAIRNEQHHPIGSGSLTRDITQQHEAEGALRESEERLQKFLNANAEGLVFHERGTITDVNPSACTLLGADRRELLGTSLLDRVHPVDRFGTAAVLLGTEDSTTEASLINPRGESRPVEFIGRSVWRQSQRLRAVVIRDIRDRRQAQARIHTLIEDLRSQKDRAEAADRAKSVFLAAASHDLRQPIHALGLFLTALRAMAQSTCVPSTELAQICRRMQSSLDGLGQLLNMLLDVSRLDANAVQVELAALPLAQLFAELDQEFADLAHEKGLRLHVASSSAWVRTDATVLRRILSNLMANAIRYSPRGRILLGARSRGDRLEIQVWDQGIGIAPEQLEAIFEEFYQIDAAHSRRSQSHGLGLGLSIVKRSARLIDAPLRVCSTPGRGSLFCISVPRAPAHTNTPSLTPTHSPTHAHTHTHPHAHAHAPSPTEPAQRSERSTAAPAPGARRVLVIDDEEQVLMGMQQLLQVWGHQVWCASSADEAVVLAIAHAHEIDLLLSDYRLGGNMTAVQAIAAVHACLPAPVPTYILTGDTSPQRIQEASELGFPLLHKPVEPDALLAALEA